MASVLIIGGGGREHALAWKMAQSHSVDKIYVAPGNGGTQGIAQNVPINFTDADALLAFAQTNQINLTVIGQEAASAAGVVDAFQAAGLKVFGPTRAAVQIEASKAESKLLMQAQQIPTAKFQNFTDPNLALAYIKQQTWPQVIKADGLAEGKGVVIAQNLAEAETAIDKIMVQKAFGDSGTTVVIEEFLSGQEVSIHALCDGKTSLLFPASQDHKQVNDNDQGPNTGGMGVFAPVPWVTDEHLNVIQNRVVQPALDGLAKNVSPFTGCLYPGLMIDGSAVKVVEFNARFGDPEAQTYMRLFDGDLYDTLLACADGQLDPTAISWKTGFAISVAVASGGYPGAYQKGLPIIGIDQANDQPDIVVFQAGTSREADGYKTAGGRVLYVSATGESLEAARTKAYQAIRLISFEGMHYRTDIGNRPSPV